MKRKLLNVALAVATALMVAACAKATGASDASTVENEDGAARFTVYDEDGNEYFTGYRTRVIQDNQTGVRYLFYKDGYGGGLTVLLDSDGTPDLDPEAGE